MIPMRPGPDFEQIAGEALGGVLATRFKLNPVSVSLDEIPEAPGDVLWMTSSVNLEGTQAQGSVHLQISESLLERINESLGDCSHEPSARESELADLAGELCNMVAGRIGAGLAAAGHLFTMGTPTVLRGWGPEAGSGADKWGSHTGWTCGGGTVILTIRIQ